MIAARGLTKSYRAHLALDHLDLDVPQGSVFGVVGPNGAGKTTLLSIIAGLRRPDSGDLRLGAPRSAVAVCPDQPEFEPWLTATEVVHLAGTLADQPPSRPRVEELLAHAGLTAAADRRVGGFSRGMTQRLAVAATVVADPDLVVLDEPCAALDPAGRVEVLDVVTHLAGRATVIFSSHILADVQRVCDHVAVMSVGRVLHQGPLDQLLRQTEPVWRIRLRRASRCADRLATEPWVSAVEQLSPNELRVVARNGDEAERHLAGAIDRLGVQLIALEPEIPTLEDIFLAITAER